MSIASENVSSALQILTSAVKTAPDTNQPADNDHNGDETVNDDSKDEPEPPDKECLNNWEKFQSQIPVIITDSGSMDNTISAVWAESIDVSRPVPEFPQKIKCMAHTFPFELDNFQKQAILKLEDGHHVLVAAHTSAGKTVVAEYAIAMSRKQGKRVIYTSPTKALSNQKYNDFNEMFGDVGLLTGDLQINHTASCLVMTTEILRSMLYYDSDATKDLMFVIFDEVHYINNVERGHVWEEIIILLPDHVGMVMLSATVPNTVQFADWVGRTKKRKVFVVSSPKRPVPLCHYLYTGFGEISKDENMFLILDQDEQFQTSGYKKAVAANRAKGIDLFDKYCYQMSGMTYANYLHNKCQLQGWWASFTRLLKERDQLPMVAFILSRKRCDSNAENLTSLDLTTREEKLHIKSFFRNCVQRLNKSDRELRQVTWLQGVLAKGIGVHHSGMFPILKETVEMLFQGGYVKVLFATETFAMGMNMPARTVVFEDITKFDGVLQRILYPAEYTQMAGRAGRRGLDDIGTVIILCKEVVPDEDVLKRLLLGTPQKLSSQFRFTYIMMLNLLQKKTLSVKGMMQESFREVNQMHIIDKYRRQSNIAEKDHLEKCSEPLPSHLESLVPFYETAAKYIIVLEKVMPMMLNNSIISREIVEGRILVVSAGPYINQLAVFLNNRGPKATPYKVLLLETKIQDDAEYNFEMDDDWYLMLSFSVMCDYIGTDNSTLDHTIVCIAPKNVVAVTKVKIEIDHQTIITNWETRQCERFKDATVGESCARAVQELSEISRAVRSGGKSLDLINYAESLYIITKQEYAALEMFYSTKEAIKERMQDTVIPGFKTQFAILYGRKLAERNVEKYRKLLAIENLGSYPDYKKRMQVLEDLGYIENGNEAKLTLKGRIACTIGTNELIVTELIFRNLLTDRTPPEIAAMLSAVSFEGRAKLMDLPKEMSEGMQVVWDIECELAELEQKYFVDKFEGQPDRLNFGVMWAIHEWASMKPFGEIKEYTFEQEGVLVRCIQQLHEILVNVRDAAAAIGDTTLQAKMIEAASAIKRDIVFTSSLYTSQDELKPTSKDIAAVLAEHEEEEEASAKKASVYEEEMQETEAPAKRRSKKKKRKPRKKIPKPLN